MANVSTTLIIIIFFAIIITIIMNGNIIITFVALIGWGTMRPPVECAEAAEEVGKGR